MKLRQLIFLLIPALVIFSCNPPVKSEEEKIDPISELNFSYLQDNDAIFVSTKVESRYNGKNLTSVQLLWYGKPGFDLNSPDSVFLNDKGNFGDILENDDFFSRKILNSDLINGLTTNDTGTVFLKIVSMYTSGSSEFLSDSFSLGNIKPRFLWLSVPDTLVRPDTGFASYLLESKVNDANGMEDIQWVGFTSRHVGPDTMLNNGNYLFLYDDGSSDIIIEPDIRSGDIAEGDSIYTLNIILPYYAKTGEMEWSFRIQDWSNDWRDTTHTIFVLE